MTHPITVASILSLVANKIIGSLVSKGAGKMTDVAFAKLESDNAQRAFQQALGDAIKRYSTTGTRLVLAEVLLQEDSPLTTQSVADELAYVLRFEREPNYKLIGDRWKAVFEDPPKWRDFDFEAEMLVNYFQDELKASDVFGPVMKRRSIEEITEKVAISNEALSDVVGELNELRSLMNFPISNLLRAITGARFNIQEQVRDFTWYIENKTRDFVGREFVFDKVDAFIQSNPCGYFIVRGDPGIGKTALAAQWVKMRDSIHHFNIRSLGINRTEPFLQNICAQLIAAYDLDHHFIPPDAIQDGNYLMKLLNEASEKLEDNGKIVITVDALDEVDDIGTSPGNNLLYLPPILPSGVFFFITTRRTDTRLRIECEQDLYDIDQDNFENVRDVTLYVESKIEQPGIHKYIADQKIKEEFFIERMVSKSQGNFMYLFYILKDINREIFGDVPLEELPVGLLNYYDDHWRRMRQKSSNDWASFKLPVVIALSIIKEPVSIDLISDFSTVTDRRQIRSVLNEWQQFLYETKVEYKGGLQKRWRVYHDSFREFIASKDEVEGELVDLKKAHGVIADTLWMELFGDEEIP